MVLPTPVPKLAEGLDVHAIAFVGARNADVLQMVLHRHSAIGDLAWNFFNGFLFLFCSSIWQLPLSQFHALMRITLHCASS